MKTPKTPKEVTARGPGAPTSDKRRRVAIDPTERMVVTPGVQRKPEPRMFVDDRRRQRIFEERRRGTEDHDPRESRKVIPVYDDDGNLKHTIVTSTSGRD